MKLTEHCIASAILTACVDAQTRGYGIVGGEYIEEIDGDRYCCALGAVALAMDPEANSCTARAIAVEATGYSDAEGLAFAIGFDSFDHGAEQPRSPAAERRAFALGRMVREIVEWNGLVEESRAALAGEGT